MKVLASAILASFLAQGWGCDRQQSSSVDEPYTAPRPAHPAMTAPAGVAAPNAERGAEVGELPPGHPPLAADDAPPIPAPRTPADKGEIQRKLAALGLLVSIPEGWIEEGSASPMRLGTVRLPRVEGDTTDGEISVSQAGGNLADNINRWRGQFQENPEPVTRKLAAAAGLEVTVVEMEGTFLGGGGPMAAKKAEPAPGTRLWGAIVKAPARDDWIFLKAWGPKKTMERWQGSFDEFLSSLRPAR